MAAAMHRFIEVIKHCPGQEQVDLLIYQCVRLIAKLYRDYRRQRTLLASSLYVALHMLAGWTAGVGLVRIETYTFEPW
jgi:hypothetical protein